MGRARVLCTSLMSLSAACIYTPSYLPPNSGDTTTPGDAATPGSDAFSSDDTFVAGDSCVAESPGKTCLRLGLECGGATVPNNCGATVTINCDGCTGGHFCNTPVARCDPLRPPGSNCTDVGPEGCDTGHCQNGYCCNSGNCCAGDADCDALESPPFCTNPPTCDGTFSDLTCDTSFRCISALISSKSYCIGVLCRPQAGECDVPELCSGGNCPSDQLVFNDSLCSSGTCQNGFCVPGDPDCTLWGKWVCDSVGSDACVATCGGYTILMDGTMNKFQCTDPDSATKSCAFSADSGCMACESMFMSTCCGF